MPVSKADIEERKRVDAFMAAKQRQAAAARKPAQPTDQEAASAKAAKLRKNITDKYAPSGFARLIKALGG